MSEARPRALVVDSEYSSELPYVRLLRQHFDLIPAFTPCEGLAELDTHDDRSKGIDIVISRRDHLLQVKATLGQDFSGLVVTAGTLLNADRQAAGEAIGGESPGRTAILRLQADQLMPGSPAAFYNF